MSTLLGSGLEYIIGLNASVNEDRLQPLDYKLGGYGIMAYGERADGPDVMWPRSQGLNGCCMAGGGGGAGIVNPDPAAQIWEWNVDATGNRHRKVISGQVLNSLGATVSGATVMLFNTATGLIVDTQTSDAGGNYQCSDPNAVSCFLVAYLAGSPDTCGTTVDEIVGS